MWMIDISPIRRYEVSKFYIFVEDAKLGLLLTMIIVPSNVATKNMSQI